MVHLTNEWALLSTLDQRSRPISTSVRALLPKKCWR